MTRGLPAVWSSVFGAPFVAVGAYVYAFQTEYPLFADQPSVPPMAGVPLVGFGLFIVALGLYVQFANTPDRPTMRDGEFVVDERDPAQRSALLTTFASVPFLAAAIDLLYFTTYPLVYPTLALAVGLYLFSTGIHAYWRNTLTSYVLTNRRMLEEYRFVSLSRTEVPLEKVRAVEERRSAVDTLFGLGDVHVRAGSTGDLSVTVGCVYDSTAFADEIRDEMSRVGDSAPGDVRVDGRAVDADPRDAAAVTATERPSVADAAETPSVVDVEGSVESLPAGENDGSVAPAGDSLGDGALGDGGAEPLSDGGTVESSGEPTDDAGDVTPDES